MTTSTGIDKTPVTPPPVAPLAKETGIVVSNDLFDKVGQILKDEIPATKYVIVSDSTVWPLYGERLVQSFLAAGLPQPPYKVVTARGEATKSRGVKADIEDWLLSLECDRKLVIVALGGGVIGDLTGYVAATYMRGVRFVQIPTSLLAMVDASVGGKTAINVPAGKNLVGSFHIPERVFIDVSLLKTLPDRQFRNGLAEVIKMAAILDAELFTFLETVSDTLNANDTESVLRLVERSVALKAWVVEQDLKEGGLRATLNYGHTVGHAIEALLTPELLHGECVSIGMVREAVVGRAYGVTPSATVSRLLRCLKAYKLPVVVPHQLKVDDMMLKMNVDKKTSGGSKKVCMITDVGSVLPQAVPVSDLSISTSICHNIMVQPQSTPLSGKTRVPGSKSISNRVLLMACLGEGECAISGLLHSDDTQVMLDALQALGATNYRWENGGATLVVKGTGGKLTPTTKQIFLGNAGTASRFLTTACTLVSGGTAHLTGVKRLTERPVKDLVDALRGVGCSLEYCKDDGCLPLDIKGTGLPGGRIELSPTISSQYVSSILISAPYAQSEVTLVLTGRAVSQPYIDMTTGLMRQFGVDVKTSIVDGQTVFVVPKGGYKNPPSMYVESDASSATYPLCFAAATGGTVTTLGVGTSSLQGDAGFCNILQALGCTLEQTEDTTTITAPKSGKLHAAEVDMETTTDAFMGAAVLMALAEGTSRITGIANQRVKECNRIQVMIDELGKCGVTCRDLPDGIEVEGIAGDLTKLRPATINCHHDHRIAMSFAVLGAVHPNLTITQKECTDKTFHEFWEYMSRDLGMVGGPAPDASVRRVAEQSVVLIGMRSAGKTFLGQYAAPKLGYTFIDMDDYLAEKVGKSVKEFIENDGWEKFRAAEVETLREVLAANPTKAIIACGGGIVESPSANLLLDSYDIVVHIRRDPEDVISYLKSDPSKPAYPEPIEDVWARRSPLFDAHSKFEFRAAKGDIDWDAMGEDFVRFVKAITVPRAPEGPNTYFLSLTFPDVREVTSLLPGFAEEHHALELRVDLLAEPLNKDYVLDQLAVIRRHSNLPVIFTVRSIDQGGKFPNDEKLVMEMMEFGLRAGCEYIDVEACWSLSKRLAFCARKNNSRIISSYHVWGQVQTTEEDLLAWADACYMTGAADIVKLVYPAHCPEDNLTAARFACSSRAVAAPIICICTGEQGALSRVLNPVMTPVTSAALPVKAAVGQVSVAEIAQARKLMNLTARDTKQFCIFGENIEKSPSPAMHNAGFKALGLPHQYSLNITNDIEQVKHTIWAKDFGGASVTMPLKEQVQPLLHDLTPSAQAIGAVNTIIRRGSQLIGDNTDWLGIRNTLAPKLDTAAAKGQVGLVLGAGGTSRAALYALQSLGMKLVIVNRTHEKAEAVGRRFGATAIPSLDGVVSYLKDNSVKLGAIVSTLPPGALDVATIPEALWADKPVAFDVCYRPLVTPFLEAAQAKGCAHVIGRNMLIEQGIWQMQRWTDVLHPPAAEMSSAAVAFYDQ